MDTRRRSAAQNTKPSAEAQADRELIVQALQGDREAGNVLAERLLVVPRFLSILSARSRVQLASHELEDLTQDVLAAVWPKLGAFQGVGSLDAWLFRFCYFEFRNQARRRARRQVRTDLEDVSAPPEVIDGFGELEQHLVELGPPEEEILRLRHQEGLSFAALGEKLALSPNTVKTRYYRGLRWLRRRLASYSEHFDEPA